MAGFVARMVCAMSIAACAQAPFSQAQAQSFPDRTVKIVVPAAAGGAIDSAGRILAQALGEHWKKPVIVENRTGASMAIGATAVAQAEPDGYTLLVAHDGVMAVNPIFIKNLTYDPQRDYAALGIFARAAIGLFVHESLPVKSVAEFVAYAKASPGKLNHGSGGPASTLSLELFKAMAGIEVANLNYRGSALSIADLISGNIQFVFADLSSGAPALNSPKVRTLGVSTLERIGSLPNVPTIHESGVPQYSTATWIGAFAPVKTPAATLAVLEQGLQAISRNEDMKKRIVGIGMEPATINAADAAKLVVSDHAKWAKLVRERNVTLGD